MAIPFSNYVEITSSVGGAAGATQRELILRLNSENPVTGTERVLEFTTLASVGVFYGTTSSEYLQAQFYFGFISKLSTVPSKISFSFWPEADTPPEIYGTPGAFVLSTFTPITDGRLNMTLGGTTVETGAINTSGDASLAAVAATITTAIQLGGTLFTTATVTFNATTSRFEMTNSVDGAANVILLAATTGTDLGPLLGWGATAIFSDGVAAQTLTAFLDSSTAISNNYGSFSFVETMLEVEITEIATWNNGKNVQFIYLEKVLSADAATVQGNIATFGGASLTLYDAALTTEFPWLFPGAIMAATPYLRRNSVQNYMFQDISGLTASVTDSANQALFDGISVNYYGQTQTAGVFVDFYQRGFLQGTSTDPLDMGVYANEVFLKDAAGVAIMNLLLALSAVPANDTGTAQVLAVVQGSIETALFNGTISVGKELSDTQVAVVTSVTGDDTAFLQIQNIGYWIDAVITEPTANEFVVVYTLLYSKNDVIRKVEGTHTLI